MPNCENHPDRPARHSIYQHGKERTLCCECYVKEGNPPADWHSGCMETYHAMKSNKA